MAWMIIIHHMDGHRLSRLLTKSVTRIAETMPVTRRSATG